MGTMGLGVTLETFGAVGERAPGVGTSPTTETMIHEGEAMSYEQLMASEFQNTQDHLDRRCELRDMAI